MEFPDQKKMYNYVLDTWDQFKKTNKTLAKF